MASGTVREPETLLEAVAYFSDHARAFRFVMNLRWPDGQVACPRCGSLEHSFLTTRQLWKCKGCKRQFSLKVGTIFEDSPIGWDKWLPAVWLIANAKNSVSSHEMARSLGVTQKTAWFMLHRIRTAMETKTFKKLNGTVEVDETYIGGQAKNMHKWIRVSRIKGRGPVYKTAVQGARNRENGTVHAEVAKGHQFKANVYKWIELGATVYTDDARAYQGLAPHYAHAAIKHDHEYVRGNVHTNGIENFWALLKRAIKGTQVHVSPGHLHRYVVERVFAYNNRETDDLGRMRLAVAGAPGRRLTWEALTSRD